MSAVNDLYRSRLADAEARMLLDLDALWAAAGDGADGDTAAMIGEAGAAAGPLVTAAQLAFIAETVVFLRAYTAAELAVRLAEVAPYVVPAGVAGFAAAGIPVGVVTGWARAVFLGRVGRGQAPAEALAGARSFVQGVAVSEPYRAANTAVLSNARDDERLTGRVKRVTEPGACPWCVMIADRGYIPAHAGFAAHRRCRCTAAPEISSHVYTRQGIRRARAALGVGLA